MDNDAFIGAQLDALANTHPFGDRGATELCAAARKICNASPAMCGAKMLVDALQNGGCALILTGFVIEPCGRAETDGAVGAVMLADALSKAFGAQCVAAVPRECRRAMRAMGFGGKVVNFTKNTQKAARQGQRMIKKFNPKIVIAAECPGADENGVYHNAAGADVTASQAKSDVLFELCRAAGIASIAIGDRGNETGMGALRDAVKKHIPHGGSIAAASQADCVVTGAASEWGIYALLFALSYLTGETLITAARQQRLLHIACENGLVDMTGESRPYVDGIAPAYHRSLINKMEGVTRPCADKP